MSQVPYPSLKSRSTTVPCNAVPEVQNQGKGEDYTVSDPASLPATRSLTSVFDRNSGTSSTVTNFGINSCMSSTHCSTFSVV